MLRDLMLAKGESKDLSRKILTPGNLVNSKIFSITGHNELLNWEKSVVFFWQCRVSVISRAQRKVNTQEIA